MITDEKLSNLQLELLKIFKYNISENQLNEIRGLLVSYFSQNISNEMDKVWEENNWNQKTIDEWVNEHSRISYKDNS